MGPINISYGVGTVLQPISFLARRDDFLVGQAVRLSPPAIASALVVALLHRGSSQSWLAAAFQAALATLNALGVLGIEFEVFGHQVLAVIGGLGHAFVSVLLRIGEHMEKLMRQNASHRAA
jgi:hypothetical protein